MTVIVRGHYAEITGELLVVRETCFIRVNTYVCTSLSNFPSLVLDVDRICYSKARRVRKNAIGRGPKIPNDKLFAL